MRVPHREQRGRSFAALPRGLRVLPGRQHCDSSGLSVQQDRVRVVFQKATLTPVSRLTHLGFWGLQRCVCSWASRHSNEISLLSVLLFSGCDLGDCISCSIDFVSELSSGSGIRCRRGVVFLYRASKAAVELVPGCGLERNRVSAWVARQIRPKQGQSRLLKSYSDPCFKLSLGMHAVRHCVANIEELVAARWVISHVSKELCRHVRQGVGCS